METKINIAKILPYNKEKAHLLRTTNNLILGILLVVLSICLGMAIMNASDEKIGVIISYFGFIFGLFLIIGYVNSKPKAIDVYKGKTELRITYEGNTLVDSVVVFKK